MIRRLFTNMADNSCSSFTIGQLIEIEIMQFLNNFVEDSGETAVMLLFPLGLPPNLLRAIRYIAILFNLLPIYIGDGKSKTLVVMRQHHLKPLYRDNVDVYFLHDIVDARLTYLQNKLCDTLTSSFLRYLAMKKNRLYTNFNFLHNFINPKDARHAKPRCFCGSLCLWDRTQQARSLKKDLQMHTNVNLNLTKDHNKYALMPMPRSDTLQNEVIDMLPKTKDDKEEAKRCGETLSSRNNNSVSQIKHCNINEQQLSEMLRGLMNTLTNVNSGLSPKSTDIKKHLSNQIAIEERINKDKDNLSQKTPRFCHSNTETFTENPFSVDNKLVFIFGNQQQSSTVPHKIFEDIDMVTEPLHKDPELTSRSRPQHVFNSAEDVDNGSVTGTNIRSFSCPNQAQSSGIKRKSEISVDLDPTFRNVGPVVFARNNLGRCTSPKQNLSTITFGEKFGYSSLSETTDLHANPNVVNSQCASEPTTSFSELNDTNAENNFITINNLRSCTCPKQKKSLAASNAELSKPIEKQQHKHERQTLVTNDYVEGPTSWLSKSKSDVLNNSAIFGDVGNRFVDGSNLKSCTCPKRSQSNGKPTKTTFKYPTSRNKILINSLDHLPLTDMCQDAENTGTVVWDSQRPFMNKTCDMEYIIELYDFPSNYVTDDILSTYSDKPSYVMWCSDTSALLVTGSASQAKRMLNKLHKHIKSRPFLEASPLAKGIAYHYNLEPAH